MLLSPWFAVAGLVLAAGPIVIHLLNRQRFRVIEWAAMEFLRQAVRRSRRLMRVQDLLLLAVRVLCVLLFGLAMARPYFSGSGQTTDPNQPVHAVLVVDNSLSMGYEQLGRNVLDEAKTRGKEFIDRLPLGSRISVVPLCAASRDFSLDAYSTKEDAVEALTAIQAADRSATAAAAFDLAKQACGRTPSPPSKQIILLSDQQAANWPTQSLAAQIEQLGGPLQVVELAPKDPGNAWIADFRLQDGIADLETPGIFLATVRFEGAAPRRDVQVTLSIDGAVFATQAVDLEPGQAREIRFPPYRFDQPLQPGQVTHVPVEVSIPHDHLPMDDRRVLAVPVVSALPVVMADQWGADESPERNRFGETRRLRQLLAPVTVRQGRDPQLIRIRHVKFDQIDRELLQDARLVLIAGVRAPQPSGTVGPLREYIEQGGSVILAAGGDFDAVQWNQEAWQNGMGILPAPLKPDPVGALPGESKRLEPFQLDVSSLVHEYFLLEQTPREELEALYRRAYFFKAIDVDLGAGTNPSPPLAEKGEERGEKGENGGSKPQWLLWSASLEDRGEQSLTAAELAEESRPRVLGSFTNQVPFLVEREIGRGRVLFVSTGIFRDWNILTNTEAVVVFDRMIRDLLQRTLPRRNLTSSGQMVFPVSSELRSAAFALADPAGREEPVSVDALGGERHGVTIGNLAQRGLWRLVARSAQSGAAGSEAKILDVPLAANGPAEESELRYLDEAGLRDRLADAEYRWIGPGDSIRVTAGIGAGRDLWKWLMASVLVGLLAESSILAWPLLRREKRP
jgi:hypothetical protein